MSSLNGSPIAVGDSRETVVVAALTRTRIVQYAGASGDFYEIHYDQEFARATGLPHVILHGLLKAGFLAQLITSAVGPLTDRSMSVTSSGRSSMSSTIT